MAKITINKHDANKGKRSADWLFEQTSERVVGKSRRSMP